MVQKQKTESQEIELIPGSPLIFQLVDWFHEHGRFVAYAIVALLVVLLSALVWAGQRQGTSEKSYIGAQVSYEKFFKIAADQIDPAKEQPFLALQEAMEEHPDLSARYEGPVAQVFLRVAAMEPALIYGGKALTRLSNENFPFFEDFSKTSLLIVQEEEQEALKRALFLQKKMLEAGGKDAITMLNQLRIAMLYGRMGNKVEESNAWRQWERLVITNPQAAQQIADGFKTGKVSLADYIAARKKDLS